MDRVVPALVAQRVDDAGGGRSLQYRPRLASVDAEWLLAHHGLAPCADGLHDVEHLARRDHDVDGDQGLDVVVDTLDPVFSCDRRARSADASVTATTSTPGTSANDFRCSAPIRPTPTTPIRSVGWGLVMLPSEVPAQQRRGLLGQATTLVPCGRQRSGVGAALSVQAAGAVRVAAGGVDRGIGVARRHDQ